MLILLVLYLVYIYIIILLIKKRIFLAFIKEAIIITLEDIRDKD
jgi:hypothetical protein